MTCAVVHSADTYEHTTSSGRGAYEHGTCRCYSVKGTNVKVTKISILGVYKTHISVRGRSDCVVTRLVAVFRDLLDP